MPHVSRQQIKAKIREKLEKRISDFLSNTSIGVRKRIFHEIITPTEHIMLAKRLAILFYVNKGLPIHKISHLIRVSPSTVARFELAVDRGKYDQTIKWLVKESKLEWFVDFIVDLAALPLDVRKRSLNKFLKDEM